MRCPSAQHIVLFLVSLLLVLLLLHLPSKLSAGGKPDLAVSAPVTLTDRLDKIVTVTSTSPPATTTLSPKDLKAAALSCLASCSSCAPHRSNWLDVLRDPNPKYLVPNTLHMVRYGGHPVTFTEAVCIRAFLTQQKPDKFYLHSNLVDLSHFGQYWDQLYKEPELQLEEKLRVVMSRDPYELSILGKKHVSSATATIYWKFHVLHKYGGFVLDTNILVQQSLEQLRSGNFSALTFPDKKALKGQNQTFALSKGTILAASPGAPLLTRLLTLATTTMTEEEFPSRIDDMVKEVLASKTEEQEGGVAVRLEGDQLKITPALAKGATEGVARLLETAWTSRNMTQAESG